MEAKSYGMQFLFFEKLISHWSRLRFLLAVHPCDHAVDSFPKWYDTWKSAQKWGRESHFFNLVTFLTNTKKFKNPWLGAPGPFFGLFQWCQGMFLKVPEGFQRKKFSSCAETKLVPIISDGVKDGDRKELNELVLPEKWRIDTLENIKEDHFVSRLNNLVRFCGESFKSPNKHIWKLL